MLAEVTITDVEWGPASSESEYELREASMAKPAKTGRKASTQKKGETSVKPIKELYEKPIHYTQRRTDRE